MKMRKRINYIKKSISSSKGLLLLLILLFSFIIALVSKEMILLSGAFEQTGQMDKISTEDVYLMDYYDEQILDNLKEKAKGTEEIGRTYYPSIVTTESDPKLEKKEAESYSDKKLEDFFMVRYSEELLKKLNLHLVEGTGFTSDPNEVIIGPDAKNISVGDTIHYGVKKCRVVARASEKTVLSPDQNDSLSPKIGDTPYLNNVCLAKGKYCIFNPKFSSINIDLSMSDVYLKIPKDTIETARQYLEQEGLQPLIDLSKRRADYKNYIMDKLIRCGRFAAICILFIASLLIVTINWRKKRKELDFLLYCGYGVCKSLFIILTPIRIAMLTVFLVIGNLFIFKFGDTRKGPDYVAVRPWQPFAVLLTLVIIFLFIYLVLVAVTKRKVALRMPTQNSIYSKKSDLDVEFPDFMDVKMALYTPIVFRRKGLKRLEYQVDSLVELCEVRAVIHNRAFAISEENRRLLNAIIVVIGNPKTVHLQKPEEVFVDQEYRERYLKIIQWAEDNKTNVVLQ